MTKSMTLGTVPLASICSLGNPSTQDSDKPRCSAHRYSTTYGPPDAQVQSVTDDLTQAGLSNISVSSHNLLITADGSASQIDAAFNTQLDQFSQAGQNSYANVTLAEVPPHCKAWSQAIPEDSAQSPPPTGFRREHPTSTIQPLQLTLRWMPIRTAGRMLWATAPPKSWTVRVSRRSCHWGYGHGWRQATEINSASQHACCMESMDRTTSTISYWGIPVLTRRRLDGTSRQALGRLT